VPTNTILALAVGTLRFAHPTSDSSRPGTAVGTRSGDAVGEPAFRRSTHLGFAALSREPFEATSRRT